MKSDEMGGREWQPWPRIAPDPPKQFGRGSERGPKTSRRVVGLSPWVVCLSILLKFLQPHWTACSNEATIKVQGKG